MFSEAYAGVYKEKVHWFAGVAEDMVHVTLHKADREDVFYDFMTEVNGVINFQEQLDEMCEIYFKRFITILQITSGDVDDEEK